MIKALSREDITRYCHPSESFKRHAMNECNERGQASSIL